MTLEIACDGGGEMSGETGASMIDEGCLTGAGNEMPLRLSKIKRENGAEVGSKAGIGCCAGLSLCESKDGGGFISLEGGRLDGGGEAIAIRSDATGVEVG